MVWHFVHRVFRSGYRVFRSGHGIEVYGVRPGYRCADPKRYTQPDTQTQPRSTLPPPFTHAHTCPEPPHDRRLWMTRLKVCTHIGEEEEVIRNPKP